MAITTKVVPSLNSATTYYFNVLVKDTAGNEAAYTKKQEATLEATPPTVAVGTITFSSVTSTGATLNWTKATDNVTDQANLQYLAYYSTNATLSSVSEIEANGTAIGTYTTDINSKPVSGLTANTNYYCNVIVKDQAGNKTSYTKTLLSLDTSAPVAGGEGSIAIPPETATANEVVLNWTKATDNLTAQAQIQYLVYYSTNSAMDSVSDVHANGTPFGTWEYDINTKTITGLTAGTTYYFNILIRDMGNLSAGMLGANETAYGKQQYITPSLDVSIASTVPDTGTTLLTLVPFTVTFELAGYPLNDSTFIESDISVTNGTVDTGSLTGTGTSWSFDVVPTTFGAVTVEIPASRVQDTNSNNNTQSNLWTFTYMEESLDITTLGRFLLGLPRDVDVSANTIQVFSLKVGTTSPSELTQEMTDLLNTINTTGLPGTKVSTGAKQDILETKMVALRDPVIAWTPTTGNTSDVVTTEVLAAAQVDIPVGTGNPISAAAAWGIFVGTVAGAADMGKVLIRLSGTDNGIEDGNGDEVYGVLTESSGVYTLSYKKSDGSAYTILAADTTAKMDFYFVEIVDLYSFTVDSLLFPPVGGVVVHTTFAATDEEVTARMNADITLQLNIDAEITARRNADNDEITARRNADSSIQANLNVEISARSPADSSIQANIDSEATSRLASDSSLQANLLVEISARSPADSSIQANIDSEATSRLDSDSSIQANIDSEATSRLDSDSSIQANIDSEVTARTSADATLQDQIDAIAALDSSLQNSLNVEITARRNSDSTLQLNLNSEVTARTNSDTTIQANITSEQSSRLADDSSIQANILSEQSSRLSSDSTLTANLDSEISSRLSSDSSLTANLDSEISSRLSGDSLIQGNLDSETSSRLTADSSLQGNLDVETTARTDADSTLLTNISNKMASVVDVSFTAEENISAGDVVFESKGTAGQVKRANATGIATCETVIGVAIETKTTGQAILIRTFGEAVTTTDGTNFDIGRRVYVAVTNGQATKTAPTGENNVVFLLGNATATNKVSVNPNLEYLVEGSFIAELGAGMEALVGAGGEGIAAAT